MRFHSAFVMQPAGSVSALFPGLVMISLLSHRHVPFKRLFTFETGWIHPHFSKTLGRATNFTYSLRFITIMSIRSFVSTSYGSEVSKSPLLPGHSAGTGCRVHFGLNDLMNRVEIHTQIRQIVSPQRALFKLFDHYRSLWLSFPTQSHSPSLIYTSLFQNAHLHQVTTEKFILIQ